MMSPSTRTAARGFIAKRARLQPSADQMCTGRPAFGGANPTATLAAILRDEPEPASRARGETLNADLERLIRKCLRKDPDRRVQTAADLRVSLEDVAEDLASGAIAGSPPRMRGARAYTRPLLAATGAIALAAVGWGGLWRSSAPPGPTPPRPVDLRGRG